MTEAWHAEQIAAAGIAPDLVNQHEADAQCGDMHCYWHHVDEPSAGAYKACGECGHVYRTEEALREAWADVTAEGYGLLPGTDVIAPPAGQIFACPLCAHDW